MLPKLKDKKKSRDLLEEPNKGMNEWTKRKMIQKTEYSRFIFIYLFNL